MNFKRYSCKRRVRCTMCTKTRWRGNSKKDQTKQDKIMQERVNDR